MFELNDKVTYNLIPDRVFKIMAKCIPPFTETYYTIEDEKSIIKHVLENKLKLYKEESKDDPNLIKVDSDKLINHLYETIGVLVEEKNILQNKNKQLTNSLENSLKQCDELKDIIEKSETVVNDKNKEIEELKVELSASDKLANFFYESYINSNKKKNMLESQNRELLQNSLNDASEIGELKDKYNVIEWQMLQYKNFISRNNQVLKRETFGYMHQLCKWVNNNKITKENIASIVNIRNTNTSLIDGFGLFYWVNE